MPKKGSKKQPKAPPALKEDEVPIFADGIPGSEPAPTFKDYAFATLRVIWQWIQTHKLRVLAGIGLGLVIIGALVWVLWPDPRPLTNDEIVTRINKELSIQGDGNPAVLTVNDKSKASQPFLQGAENGDKVVLYYKAKKSVLYRPSEKRIVHQGVYTPPDAKVFIRRGTEDVGRVGEIESKLDKLQDISIVSRDESVKRDYSGVTIVNVTDRYDEKARELEQLLGGQIVRLPAGETFPEADILIIVGN